MKIFDLFKSSFSKKKKDESIGANDLSETYLKEFHDRLQITKLYCDQQLKNDNKTTASIFRSINPIYNNKEIFEFQFRSYPSAEWTTDLFYKQNDHLIEELFEKQLFHKVETIFSFEGSDKVKGRIMISDFDQTVWDGAFRRML